MAMQKSAYRSSTATVAWDLADCGYRFFQLQAVARLLETVAAQGEIEPDQFRRVASQMVVMCELGATNADAGEIRQDAGEAGNATTDGDNSDLLDSIRAVAVQIRQIKDLMGATVALVDQSTAVNLQRLLAIAREKAERAGDDLAGVAQEIRRASTDEFGRTMEEASSGFRQPA
jgi:hypothetical protein